MIAQLETHLFQWLTTTSWQVALLVVLVLGLQLVFRRALPPRWQLALWSVVALRLVLPALPSVDGGVIQGDWAERVWSAADRSRAALGPTTDSLADERGARRGRDVRSPSEAPEVARSLLAEDRAASDADAAGALLPSASDLPRRAPASSDLSEIIAVASPVAYEPTASLTESGAPSSGRGDAALESLVVRAWLGVAAALLILLVAFEVRFRHRLRRARVVDDPEILRELALLRQVSGVRRDIEVRAVCGLGSPAVTGIFRPQLLLPDGALEEFTPEERRCVFLHELSHLRRNDVLWNGVLGVLQCLWWFHPLVHFAFSRLRQTRESARDYEALHLGAAARDRSVLYARTLLKLVEHRPDERRLVPALGFLDGGSDLKRRIVMIADYPRHSRRRGVFLGLGVLALAGWAGFTQASPPQGMVGGPSKPGAANGGAANGGALKQISVERQRPMAQWRAKLERQLDEITVRATSYEDMSIPDAFNALSVETGVTILLTDRALDELASLNSVVSLHVGPATLRELLTFVAAAHPDIDWCLCREVVAVGWGGDLPEAMDIRFYNIEPFFREFPGVEWEEVLDIARELSSIGGVDLWDLPGASIEYFNGLAVVRQTDRGHDAFLKALELVLNRGRRPVTTPPAWMGAVEKALSTPVSDVDFQDATLGDIAKWAGRVGGIPIVFESPELQYEEISLTLSNVTLAAALDWVASSVGCGVHVVGGAIRFGETGAHVTEFFAIADIARTRDGEDDPDMILDMLRNLVDPDSWDMDPWLTMRVWQGMLVVTQSPENIEEIRSFLESMRRALQAG